MWLVDGRGRYLVVGGGGGGGEGGWCLGGGGGGVRDGGPLISLRKIIK